MWTFIDGVEINLGNIEKDIVSHLKDSIKWHIHNKVPDFAVKNVQVFRMRTDTKLWITLADDTSKLTLMTIPKLEQMRDAIHLCLTNFLGDEAKLLGCDIVSLDVTADLRGSFHPDKGGIACEMMQKLLTECISSTERAR